MNYLITFCCGVMAFSGSFKVECQTLILADKENGATYLSMDQFDGFYDKVNPLEIAIQLKDTALHEANVEDARAIYKASYESEVLDIPAVIKEQLTTMFEEMFQKCNALNDELLPDTIQLIMVAGNHYGASTFFTRGNAIAFTEQSIKMMPEKSFKHVMYHELFHIISRYRHDLRDQLYQLVGFEQLDGPIWIDKSLYSRILYNPDGVSMEHGIPLMMPDSTTSYFIPVIAANDNQYRPNKIEFFSYLDFKLYPVRETESGYFMSTFEEVNEMPVAYIMKKFFERITMNTQYIIHPDEILADNFMYLFRTEEENAELDQALLKNIKTTIETYNN